MNKKPNFFIIGAPKCGTTALGEYLKEHPNVFMSTPKEPHYFATDMGVERWVSDESKYYNLFDNVNKEHIAIGEASVWYLYSKNAIENIYKFNKNSKIIVMLRKPVEMVYSLHSQQLYSGRENEFDFEKAWYLEDNRRKGKSIPSKDVHLPNLFYSEIAKYHTQLLKVYNYFPKEQVKVILFNDFKVNTKSIFDSVIEFLELPIYNKIDFPRINANQTVRNKFINNLVGSEPMIIRHYRLKFKKALGIEKLSIGSRIRLWNSKDKKRRPLNEEIKRAVIESYESEVNKLSSLLNIKLDKWNQ